MKEMIMTTFGKNSSLILFSHYSKPSNELGSGQLVFQTYPLQCTYHYLYTTTHMSWEG